jgi:hypothetical protein
VKRANHPENNGTRIGIPAVPRFCNNFIPQGTQVVLQTDKSSSDVKPVKWSWKINCHTADHVLTDERRGGMHLAGDVDQVGK